MSTTTPAATATVTPKGTVHPARKTFGWILSIAASGALFYWIAWNQAALEDFIKSVGGVPNLVFALVSLIALIVSVFWPKKWPEWVRRILLVLIIVTLLFGGGQVFVAAFEQAPWLTVLGLLGVLVAVVLLFSITILDKPVDTWRRLFRKKK